LKGKKVIINIIVTTAVIPIISSVVVVEKLFSTLEEEVSTGRIVHNMRHKYRYDLVHRNNNGKKRA
jgi:hypothetical protein